MPQVEVRLGGHLDQQWAEWFEDLSITHTEQDETLLTGTVADQAALYGLIGKLRALGVKLLSARFEEHPYSE